jgi:hypothetical protein
MAGLRERLHVADEGADVLRKLAGLLLALGLILVFIRRSSFDDTWGDLPLLLVLLLAFLFLYGTALLAGPPASTRRPVEATGTPAGAPVPPPPPEDEPSGSSWQGLYAVFGVIVLPLVFLQFLEWVDGNTEAPLNTAWIFALTAAAALAAALLLRTRYTLLLAGLALIVSWLGLWDEILTDGLAADAGTLRGLLVVIAIILLAGAVVIYLRDPGRQGIARGAELITAAGVAAVTAGGLSISFLAVNAVAPAVPVEGGFSPEGFVATPNFLWDLVLLASSLLLILFGARLAARGPVYVGAIGLVIFAFVVGLQLGDLADALGGSDLEAFPDGSILGWPLALLLIGAAALVLSILPGVRLGSLGIDRLERGEVRRRGGEGPPPPGGPPPPPGAPQPGP